MIVSFEHGTVWVTGEVGFDDDPLPLTQALDSAAATGTRVRVDLSGVTFMDSSGLATLVSAQRQIDQPERELIIVNPSARVMRLLESTALDQLFNIETSPASPA